MIVARFRKAVEERIVERANGIAEQLCFGQVSDMEHLSSLRGQLRALKDVEKWLEEAERTALSSDDE